MSKYNKGDLNTSTELPGQRSDHRGGPWVTAGQGVSTAWRRWAGDGSCLGLVGARFHHATQNSVQFMNCLFLAFSIYRFWTTTDHRWLKLWKAKLRIRGDYHKGKIKEHRNWQEIDWIRRESEEWNLKKNFRKNPRINEEKTKIGHREYFMIYMHWLSTWVIHLVEKHTWVRELFTDLRHS